MSNMTDVTIGAAPPVLSRVPVTQSLVFSVVSSEPFFVIFSLGHCIVCHFFSGPLYCLSFFLWAIVLFVIFSLGHCIVCHFFSGPLYCLSFLAHLAFRPCELLSSLFVRRLSSVVRPSTFHILIFSSETTGPIASKLWWNGLWMAPFQNCVR
jgi:hypothetical protein